MTKKIAGTTPGICNLMLKGGMPFYRSEKATSIIFVNVF